MCYICEDAASAAVSKESFGVGASRASMGDGI